MASLNTPKTRGASALRTHEGAPAKRIDAVAQLRRSVLACLLWEDQFYEDGQQIADRIAGLIQEVPPEVVASLAVEARLGQHLRHVPLLLARELARTGGPLVADTIYTIIQRPDELTEFLALYWKDGKEPLSAQVKKGLARAFTKFDAYQLAKYDRDGAVKLRDVLFLVHPVAKDEGQQAEWDALVEGTLPAPDTWEVALSGGGDKREHWTRLLQEKRLGGLALLRNLRNMEQAKVDSSLIIAAIEGHPFHRVLPFRFLAAAAHAPRYEPVLDRAMVRAAGAMQTLPGKTVLVVDHSGSMQSRLSGRSQLTRFDAAAGLAILLREVCEEVEVVCYSSVGYSYRRGNDRGAVTVPARRGMALRDAMVNSIQWGGTDTEAGKQLADHLGYDRVIILTDEQSHTALSGPDGLGYVVNVASAKNGIGYGPWLHIDGWSESVVRYIQTIEEERPFR